MMAAGACVAAGVVVGFLAATWGAAITLADLSTERDVTRDKLADQVRLAVETGATMVKEVKADLKEAQAELDRMKPKDVKGA